MDRRIPDLTLGFPKKTRKEIGADLLRGALHRQNYRRHQNKREAIRSELNEGLATDPYRRHGPREFLLEFEHKEATRETWDALHWVRGEFLDFARSNLTYEEAAEVWDSQWTSPKWVKMEAEGGVFPWEDPSE